jgi:hypothetical protein
MAKVRKKHNKGKRAIKIADHAMRNILLCYTDDRGGSMLYDTKRGCFVILTKQQEDALKLPMNWSIYVAAFGRTLVDEYFKGEQIFTTSRYYHDDLTHVLEDNHRKVIESVPEHQRCGVGWIGSVHGEDIPEKLAGEIFEKLEVWK